MRVLAHPHAHQAEPAARAALCARSSSVHEVVGRLDVEEAGLQRNQHRVGELSTASSRLPCRPAGVSSTTWVVPLGGRTMCVGATSQL